MGRLCSENEHQTRGACAAEDTLYHLPLYNHMGWWEGIGMGLRTPHTNLLLKPSREGGGKVMGRWEG